MRLASVVLIASVLAVPACASDVWMFLKDGRVGWGDSSVDPLVLTFDDASTATVPKSAISFQRTREEVDYGVAVIASDFMHGRKFTEGQKQLKILDAAAVPQLLECLKSTDLVMRAAGVYGLQFCWARAAEEPVLKSFAEDKETRLVALEALTRHVSEEKLATHFKSLADDENLEIAALLFPMVDRYYPDETNKRILRVLGNEKYRADALVRLSHYFSPELTEHMLALVASPELKLRRGGVVGLIAELSGDDAVRSRVLDLLKDANPEMREIAAEYALWLAQDADVPQLKQYCASEKDPYVRAALNGAMELIGARSKGSAEARAALLKELRSGEAIEPLFLYQTHEYATKLDYLKRARKLQEFIESPSKGAHSDTFGDAVEIPVAASSDWMPPLRDYFDPRRASYGAKVKGALSVFAGSVHIGDDCSWGNELRTVVAAAPGVVRLAGHIFSWGHIVVIEHKLPDGSAVCSLYAHLSPALSIKPGDIVKAGQRIGCIGRSHTVDNGGYYAHLHFGIHRGAYMTPDEHWVSGYVNTARWDHGDHTWVDPQVFLKGMMEGKK